MRVAKFSFLISMLAFGLVGCAPKPEEVCAHADALAQKDKGKFDKASCVSNLEMKKELSGYKEFAACAQKAASIEEYNTCNKKFNEGLK